MAAAQLLRAEAEPLDGARCQILDPDVGLGQHALDQRLVLGPLHVDGYRLLPAVQPYEIGGEAVHVIVVAAGEIPLGALQLDDAGAGVGQPARQERRGDRLFERDDEEAVEGTWHSTSFA